MILFSIVLFAAGAGSRLAERSTRRSWIGWAVYGVLCIMANIWLSGWAANKAWWFVIILILALIWAGDLCAKIFWRDVLGRE